MYRIVRLLTVVGALLVYSGMGTDIRAQLPDLAVEIADVEAYPGETQVRVPVTMSNFYEGVAGFDLRLTIEQPRLLEFSGPKDVFIDTLRFLCTDYNSLGTCIDSTLAIDGDEYDFIHVDTITQYFGAVDTVASLVGGWEVIDVRSTRRNGTTLRIVGLADSFGGGIVPPIPTQSGGVLLWLLADAAAIGNDATERLATLKPRISPTEFCFSSPEGQCIGLTSTEVLDSICYRCTAWIDSVCVHWASEDEPPCDSIMVKLDTIPVYEASAIVADSGSVAINQCGLTGTLPTPIDIAALVDFLFTSGSAPGLGRVDADCSCSLDPIDLATVVDFLFVGVPIPPCN